MSQKATIVLDDNPSKLIVEQKKSIHSIYLPKDKPQKIIRHETITPKPVSLCTRMSNFFSRLTKYSWTKHSIDDVKNQDVDFIIIGAGLLGCALAHHIHMQYENMRVLLIERGPFYIFLPNRPPATTRLSELTAEQQCILKPPVDNSNVPLAYQAYCVDGKGNFWAGWIPRMSREELKSWPQEIVTDLFQKYYKLAENILQPHISAADQKIHENNKKQVKSDDISSVECEVASRIGILSDPMKWFESVHDKELTKKIKIIDIFENVRASRGRYLSLGYNLYDLYRVLSQSASYTIGRATDLVANIINFISPMTYTGQIRWSSCGYDIVSIMKDYDELNVPLCQRKTILLSDTTVTNIITENQQATHLHTNEGVLTISPKTKVLLASGPYDTTKLILNSYPQIKKTDIMIHAISATHFRVENTTLEKCPFYPMSSLLIKFLWQDTYVFQVQLSVKKVHGIIHSNNIEYRCTTSCETKPNVKECRHLSNNEVYLSLSKEEDDLFADATEIGNLLVQEIVKAHYDNEEGKVRVFVNDKLVNKKESIRLVRQSLGDTYHECGTLPIGTYTDDHGFLSKFNMATNIALIGASTFPTSGSANPTLTALALGLRTVDFSVKSLVNMSKKHN